MSFANSTRTRARRIVTFEEFTTTPRTPAEVECYRTCLATLQRMGMVDADLNIISGRAKVGSNR